MKLLKGQKQYEKSITNLTQFGSWQDLCFRW